VLRQAGFDSVRQVTIDDDWSALRFRRVEFIKQSKQWPRESRHQMAPGDTTVGSTPTRGPASLLPTWIQFLRLWKSFHNAERWLFQGRRISLRGEIRPLICLALDRLPQKNQDEEFGNRGHGCGCLMSSAFIGHDCPWAGAIDADIYCGNFGAKTPMTEQHKSTLSPEERRSSLFEKSSHPFTRIMGSNNPCECGLLDSESVVDRGVHATMDCP